MINNHQTPKSHNNNQVKRDNEKIYDSNDNTSPLYERPFPNLKADLKKQKQVRNAFLHAWKNYKKYAWGYDFLKPLSKKGKNVFSGGLMITDSLDTLLLMGLDDEYELARLWVEKNFTMHGDYSVFEIIIRHLGSFLSVYQTTKDKLFLDNAIKIGEAILPLFNNVTGFFRTYASFDTKENGNIEITPKGNPEVLLSDIGSIQLEFYTLSLMSGDNRFAKAGAKIHRFLFQKYKDHALYPERLYAETGEAHTKVYSFDAMSDSFYEYLIKIWVMTNNTLPVMLQRYLSSIDAMETQLVENNTEKDLYYLIRRKNNDKEYKMSHLVTFAAGMLAVGSVKKNPKSEDHLKIADKLIDTYMKLYRNYKTGFMPEILELSKKIRVLDHQYQLRPETIESIYVMYRFTGLPKYREYAWEIFSNLEKNCKVQHGYASLRDTESGDKDDHMDSYFLAETLRYLYLIFSDSTLLPTNHYVFNTEAHPLRIWTEKEAQKMKKVINL